MRTCVPRVENANPTVLARHRETELAQQSYRQDRLRQAETPIDSMELVVDD